MLIFAQFWLTGRLDKAISVVEGGLGITALARNDKLQLALLQLRGTGTLYLSPIISVGNTKPLEIPKLPTETPFVQSDSAKSLLFSATDNSKAPFIRDSMVSTALNAGNVPRISPDPREKPTPISEENFKQPATLPKTAMRLGRLGLGPPKRAVVKTNTPSPSNGTSFNITRHFAYN